MFIVALYDMKTKPNSAPPIGLKHTRKNKTGKQDKPYVILCVEISSTKGYCLQHLS